VPCRLVDTRSGSTVGNRAAPLHATESVTIAVWGTNGNCTIPDTATAIATNATAVNSTADSYVTIYPSDANPRPTASNLNVVAGGAPTPNQVTVGLSAAGAISAYNNGGTVDLVIDIVGYYQAATGSGAQAPQGPTGPTGAPGPTCPAAGCTLNISGYAANGGSYLEGNCVYGATLRLPLNLPFGAVVTTATVRYVDTDLSPIAKFDLQLYKATLATDAIIPASATAITANQGHLVDLPLNTEAAAPVEANISYYIRAVGLSQTTLKLCGVDVAYHF
jgi:hypothetical protein